MHAMKANFMPKLVGVVALLCWLAAAGVAQALESDRTKPLLFEAGAMHYDDARQVTVFTDHVIVTRGSMTIRAARVEVRQTPEGFDQAVAYGSESALATFDETLDASPGAPTPTMHGTAVTLRYDGQSDVLTLTGRATLERRLDGKISDRAQGAVIRYDDLTDRFTVTGGHGGATAGNPDGRVRVMLSPHAASAPSRPSGASLRPTPGLGGKP